MEYIHSDKKHLSDSTAFRVFIGVLILTASIATGYLIKLYDPTTPRDSLFFSGCLLSRITGIYCPGCGGTRAVYHLLSFNILKAVSENAFVVIFILPVGAYMVVSEYLNYLFKRKILPFLRLPQAAIYLFVAILVLFTALRNIPFAPFNFLAPGCISC